METSGAVDDSADRRRLIAGLGTLSPGPVPSQPGGRRPRGEKAGGIIYSKQKMFQRSSKRG